LQSSSGLADLPLEQQPVNGYFNRCVLRAYETKKYYCTTLPRWFLFETYRDVLTTAKRAISNRVCLQNNRHFQIRHSDALRTVVYKRRLGDVSKRVRSLPWSLPSCHVGACRSSALAYLLKLADCNALKFFVYSSIWTSHYMSVELWIRLYTCIYVKLF